MPPVDERAFLFPVTGGSSQPRADGGNSHVQEDKEIEERSCLVLFGLLLISSLLSLP